MFASVTDWGNLSFVWPHHGHEDFREFMVKINTQYFSDKLYQGMTYILSTPKCQASCKRFSENILPALQKVLKEELQNQIPWNQ